MYAYLLLGLAIAAEVTGTVALKFSDGFTKLGPSLVVATGYGLAFYLLSLVLKAGIPVGVAYAIWAAFGIALIALVGVVFLGERLNVTMIAGLGLVVAGVVLVELGRSAT